MSTTPSALFSQPSPLVGSTVVGQPTKGVGNYAQQNLNSLGNTAAATAANDTSAGSGAFGSGLQSLQPAINYFTQLLGGGEEMNEALSPQFDQISQQFDQIRNSISATQPRGGGTASAMVQAPFQEAATKGEIASKARSDAASKLGDLSTAEAGLGEGEQGIGLQALGESLQEALGSKGLNEQTNFANQFQTISQGLNALI